MDIIILGFLMMQQATIYELRQFIENYLSSMSSNSTGSIQAGIKKLLKKEMIVFKEQVENGVNKKIYAITALGKKYFEDSIATPMLYKEKNMELSKLFFMGFTDKKNQKPLIDSYIKELEKELKSLEKVDESLNPRYEFDESRLVDLKEKGGEFEFTTKAQVNTVACFQYATLDLGMDKLKFEIEWFKTFRDKLEEEKSKSGDNS